MREHGTKTMPKFLPADGEASWSLFPISVSLLYSVQPPFFKGLGVNLQPNFQKVWGGGRGGGGLTGPQLLEGLLGKKWVTFDFFQGVGLQFSHKQ